jgi:hypothetical protein
MFIPLATHSASSLQEGLPLPSELARAAQAEPDRQHGVRVLIQDGGSGKYEELYNEEK